MKSFVAPYSIDECKIRLADLTCQVVIQREFVMKVISLNPKYPSRVLLGRQCLVRIGFFEKIGSAEVKLFICEEIPEFMEIHESAYARIGRRLDAIDMRSDRHGCFNFRVWARIRAQS